MSEIKSPRVLGLLLALLGATTVIGGVNLILMNDSPYFLVIGMGILVSGLLLARGKKMGAFAYAGTLSVIILWSLFEVGLDVSQLLPRIVVPSLIGAYIFSSKVKSRLA